MLFGTTISTIGFIVVLLFHSTENMISIGLTVLAAGLSLSISGGFNVILISVPMEVTGIALGMTLLLNLVGMSVGPAISGVFQETYKGTAPGIIGAFPTDHAYNMIFTTAAIISLASVAITVSMSKIRVNETATTTTAREQREPNADHR
jgi:MFS family permease